jgi:hypothetical protein
VDPSYLAFQAAAQLKRTLDTAALKEKVGRIEAAVELTNKTLAEGTLTNLRAGYLHLASAVASSQDDLRRDELKQARHYFALIESRDEAIDVAGTSATLSAAEVWALSKLGSFHYFIIRGDEKLALLQAYSCTEKFPALGVAMFPPELFSQDYRKAINSADEALNKATTALKMAQEDHRREHKIYYAQRAWAVTKAAGLMVGGVAASAVNPTFLGGAAVRAKDIVSDAFAGPFSSMSERPDGAEAARKALQNDQMLKRVASDARSRRLALERELDHPESTPRALPQRRRRSSRGSGS